MGRVSFGTAGTAKRRGAAPLPRSIAANEIEDTTKTGAVGPGAIGPSVVRAQILLDRAGFSPGEIDGVHGDDFGVHFLEEAHFVNGPDIFAHLFRFE